MTGEGEVVTVQCSNINRNVGNGLGGIEADRNIQGMAAAIISSTGLIVPSALRSKSRSRALFFDSEASERLHVQLAFIRDGDDLQAGACALAHHLPRHDVGVVLHGGDEDFITGLGDWPIPLARD